MKITWNELTVKFERGNDDLFSDWRWLIGDTVRPILIAALGDAFFHDNDGSVWWLDVAGGRFSKVAESEDVFKHAMVANVNDWFLPQLVGELLDSGATLCPNQCYSFKKPPILGGKYVAENLEPVDLSVHFSLLGQIHFRVKDLPVGTPINSITIKDQ